MHPYFEQNKEQTDERLTDVERKLCVKIWWELSNSKSKTMCDEASEVQKRFFGARVNVSENVQSK